MMAKLALLVEQNVVMQQALVRVSSPIRLVSNESDLNLIVFFFYFFVFSNFSLDLSLLIVVAH